MYLLKLESNLREKQRDYMTTTTAKLELINTRTLPMASAKVPEENTLHKLAYRDTRRGTFTKILELALCCFPKSFYSLL